MRCQTERQTRLCLAPLAVWFSTAPLLSPVAAGAEQPSPPPYYAIRDARVITVSGATLDRGTVVVADGLIDAVATDLEIPADAWVVEGAGLVLFPGLIDGLTDLGLPPAESGGAGAPAGGPPGSSEPPPVVRGPEDRPGTSPWRSAADLLDAGDSRIEKWRQAGFTGAISAPSEGFFAGQAALIALAGEAPGQMVVATPVAQMIRLDGRSGSRGFPGSLMGRIAYVRQVLSDVRHYGTVRELYAASAQGRRRPAYDRTLDPLLGAIRSDLPFLLPADHGREIDRVLALAEEYGLEAVIYGGQGAYARTRRLAASRTPVLVSLDWPQAARGRDPEADTPFPELYHRQLAPSTPAALAAAGVPFAFTSGGTATPEEAFAGVRRAVGAGLDPGAAMRALTLDAAAILGVDDRIGSIEAGKIANLTLASAEPWVEDAELEAVFVDGRYFPHRRPSPGEPPAADVTGSWELTMSSPRGEREMTARIEMAADGKVTGELESERGSRPLEQGRMRGETLSFTTTQTMGPRRVEASFSLTVEGESLSGTMSAGPMSLEVRGERSAEATRIAAAGEDDEEEAPAVARSELEEVMRLYRGPVRRYDALAITGATVWTVTGETIPDGTVLVEEGRITAVGAGLRVPRRAAVVDAAGGHLIPGIIDAHSHIAVDGGVNEGTLAVSAMVGIEDVLNPDDVAIYRALAGGVTAANILHGSSNPIGGRNAVIKLRWGEDADGLRFAGAPPGIKFALGENPKRSRAIGSSASRRYPATRMGVVDVIRQAFTDAREYQRGWQLYEASRRAGEEPLPPRVDFELQALVEILEGERLVHAHCYRADEILQLLRLAEELGFRIATLQHVLEGYKVADEIAEHGAGASTFSDWWGYKVEAYDAIPFNAALMTERGIVVSINSDSGEEMRHLNQEAAKTVKWGGLDEVSALALVTHNPARQLGIAERVGSIEVGKDADLVLYDGHPLSIFSVVQKTFVDGDLYFDREADRQRQAAIDPVKARLLGREEAAPESEPPDAPSAATATTPANTPRGVPERSR